MFPGILFGHKIGFVKARGRGILFNLDIFCLIDL